ncbi:hypothetical protein BLOT_008201 [Blomia tropicalis]|nr:hypothetical protein BLOT_008201 [Blomia tropicalis]
MIHQQILFILEFVIILKNVIFSVYKVFFGTRLGHTQLKCFARIESLRFFLLNIQQLLEL